MSNKKSDDINDAVSFIKNLWKETPGTGIVLGTGLGGLVTEISVEKEIPYNFIPHFPVATVESHFGKLICGTIGNKKVIAMQGRFHMYEGYSPSEISFPVRVMKLLGIQTLFISNAAGGINPSFKKGDLMIIDDHINLLGKNPLTGPNDERFGPRFPDMSEPYSFELISLAEKTAATENIPVKKGVYVAVPGPNLETKAEYRFLRTIGSDAVGMSTVPEVIAAVHMGLNCFAMSVITDECDPDNLKPVDIREIIEIAGKAEPKLTRIMSRMIREMNH
jgi:purine-nucleoside phosphorylase